jgi:hypothetical protein
LDFPVLEDIIGRIIITLKLLDSSRGSSRNPVLSMCGNVEIGFFLGNMPLAFVAILGEVIKCGLL